MNWNEIMTNQGMPGLYRIGVQYLNRISPQEIGSVEKMDPMLGLWVTAKQALASCNNGSTRYRYDIRQLVKKTELAIDQIPDGISNR